MIPTTAANPNILSMYGATAMVIYVVSTHMIHEAYHRRTRPAFTINPQFGTRVLCLPSMALLFASSVRLL